MNRPGGAAKALSGFRRRRKKDSEVPVKQVKQCPRCTRWYPATSECFDRDESTRSKLQSYCVECKDEWDTTTDGHLRRLRSFLLNEEPQALAAWEACEGGLEGEFRRKLDAQGGVCKYCGAGLREWQVKGHNLDRIDNKDRTLHTPKNTRFACRPCNMTRGRQTYHSWCQDVARRVAEHGWGCVPWGEVNDLFTRVMLRRCRHLAVAAPQLEFGL